MINNQDYYSIEPSIKGESNKHVNEIFFHKSKLEAIFKFENTQKATEYHNFLFSLKAIYNSDCLEENKSKKITYNVRQAENLVYITENLKQAFHLIQEKELLANWFIEEIYMNTQISAAINGTPLNSLQCSSSYFKSDSVIQKENDTVFSKNNYKCCNIL